MGDIPTKIKNKELVEKRRNQLVLAAIRVFSQKGFYKSTLRDLAREAGISHGNIYDYVGTKEDILFLLHQFIADIGDESLLKSMENVHDPCEKIRRMIHSELNLMSQWSDAILLIYQETHVLPRRQLEKLLNRESKRITKYEIVLKECIEAGTLRDCHTRVVANLIKIMVDSWVLKRWDLKDRSTQTEMESSILDLVFNGMMEKADSSKRFRCSEPLDGKRVLIVNGGTLLGQALSSFLIAKGARLAMYVDNANGEGAFSGLGMQNSEQVQFYFSKDCGGINENLFKKIDDDFGAIDIFVQDIGVGNLETEKTKKGILSISHKLESNFTCAQDLSALLQKRMRNRTYGKILYLAPWAWDRVADPVRYEIIKDGTISLTRTLAKLMGFYMTNVNCIIPGYIGIRKELKIAKEKMFKTVESIPMRRLGEISDVLEAAYFLISDSSRNVTGQIMKVAGE